MIVILSTLVHCAQIVAVGSLANVRFATVSEIVPWHRMTINCFVKQCMQLLTHYGYSNRRRQKRQ